MPRVVARHEEIAGAMRNAHDKIRSWRAGLGAGPSRRSGLDAAASDYHGALGAVAGAQTGSSIAPGNQRRLALGVLSGRGRLPPGARSATATEQQCPGLSGVDRIL